LEKPNNLVLESNKTKGPKQDFSKIENHDINNKNHIPMQKVIKWFLVMSLGGINYGSSPQTDFGYPV
jgi:hypothetical protein